MFGKQHLPQLLVGNSEADRNGSATCDASPYLIGSQRLLERWP
jgi:hypothetical protein